ncbi:methyltransferase [Amycolatopsis nigrescens]|uniref:methyltransferase n=1 Tax=Amycolatopsis nigrescens TaxID=381445 RepID=UPI00036B9C49|nr:methyltransferase [Amycolatopsis nigrescens]
MTQKSAATEDAQRTLLRLLSGAMASQVVGVAAKLEVADRLGSDPVAAGDIADRCGLAPQGMLRLLRALASLGLCAEPAPGRFTLTPVGALLRKGNPDSLHDLARLGIDPMTLRSVGELEFSLQTGRPAFDELHGKPVFTHIGEHPELSEMFNAAMSNGTRATAAALPEHYDFTRFTKVADIGGGDGTLLSAILGRHPQLTGVVFDNADGAAQAEGTIRAAGLSARCEVVTGDFFEAVPGGADLYLIKSVLHDWEDDRAVTILGNCRAVLPSNGRVLIVEPLLPDTVAAETPAQNPYLGDLTMLVLAGGQERTRADFDRLCERSGLTITGTTPLPPHPGLSLIEAVPA